MGDQSWTLGEGPLLIEALIVANLATAAGLAFALKRTVVRRARRRQRNVFSSWPIPTASPDAVAPALVLGPLGPAPDSEIVALPNYYVPGGIGDVEAWVLCNLAKTARLVFEFGTATGKTTYLLARNAPPEARIVSLTLPPDAASLYCDAEGDDPHARRAALSESASGFIYLGTPVAAKITQLFGDSKAFDATPYAELCDLVFVDASHARSYVQSDSRKALAMVRPGGHVLWHDYTGPSGARGVYDVLNALARDLPLQHIKGTTLVAYRKPL